MMKSGLGEYVRRSIELECTAPKLGNVFPGRPFEDMTHDTFLEAARSIGECVDRLYQAKREGTVVSLGTIVLRCVEAMLQSVHCNTSLGTILLVTPLMEAFDSASRQEADSAVTRERWQRQLERETLAHLSPTDAEQVYEAIRICNPGGLGSAKKMDVASSPPTRLLDAMAFASTYDDVALQYVSNFELCFDIAEKLPSLGRPEDKGFPLEAITLLQVELLAQRPDSLIVRKGGRALAESIQSKAVHLHRLAQIQATQWKTAWDGLDRWMRSLRHANGKRIANPGTHADLIAAAILIRLLLKPASLDPSEI